MPTPLLNSSAPAGVSITFRGKSIIISPTVLSGQTITALRRRLLEIRRVESRELLRTKGLPVEMRDRIIEKSLDVGMVGLAQVMKSIEIPEVLGEFISIACGKSYDVAMELVNEYPDYGDLMSSCVQAMGLGTIKNSDPPTTSGGEPENQDAGALIRVTETED